MEEWVKKKIVDKKQKSRFINCIGVKVTVRQSCPGSVCMTILLEKLDFQFELKYSLKNT